MIEEKNLINSSLQLRLKLNKIIYKKNYRYTQCKITPWVLYKNVYKKVHPPFRCCSICRYSTLSTQMSIHSTTRSPKFTVKSIVLPCWFIQRNIFCKVCNKLNLMMMMMMLLNMKVIFSFNLFNKQ